MCGHVKHSIYLTTCRPTYETPSSPYMPCLLCCSERSLPIHRIESLSGHSYLVGRSNGRRTSPPPSWSIGTPTVSGAKVSAEVVGPKLGKKLVIQKFRRRKNSRRKTGHRQMHLEVKIGKISV